MLMLYRRLIYLFLCVSAMMYVSCGKDEIDVEMSDDPGYASAPLVSIQAKDGDRWIDGTIDQETRTVSFVFHSLEVLTSVEMRAVTDETWGAMISPASVRTDNRLPDKFQVLHRISHERVLISGYRHQAR